MIDVAVMRDKNSGRSRGFAFVTFMVEDDSKPGEEPGKCRNALDLNKKMLEPVDKHLIQNRAVEIR